MNTYENCYPDHVKAIQVKDCPEGISELHDINTPNKDWFITYDLQSNGVTIKGYLARNKDRCVMPFMTTDWIIISNKTGLAEVLGKSVFETIYKEE